MGYLTYGNTTTPFEIDDELMAHLRVVVVTKLRRNESFALTLNTAEGAVETLWVHASIPLRFTVEEDVDLQRPVLVSMMDAANSGRVPIARLREVAASFDVAIVAGARAETALPEGPCLLVGSLALGVPLIAKGGDGEATG